MIDENKSSMYIVTIVGVVAAVGILVLLMGAGISENMTGQAYIKLKVKDVGGKTLGMEGEIDDEFSAAGADSATCSGSKYCCWVEASGSCGYCAGTESQCPKQPS